MHKAVENPVDRGERLRFDIGLDFAFTVLGLLAGVLLAGIPGSLAALPVIASYAAIERIWLKPFLREGVSEKHKLRKDEVFGEKE